MRVVSDASDRMNRVWTRMDGFFCSAPKLSILATVNLESVEMIGAYANKACLIHISGRICRWTGTSVDGQVRLAR